MFQCFLGMAFCIALDVFASDGFDFNGFWEGELRGKTSYTYFDSVSQVDEEPIAIKVEINITTEQVVLKVQWTNGEPEEYRFVRKNAMLFNARNSAVGVLGSSYGREYFSATTRFSHEASISQEQKIGGVSHVLNAVTIHRLEGMPKTSLNIIWHWQHSNLDTYSTFNSATELFAELKKSSAKWNPSRAGSSTHPLKRYMMKKPASGLF